jgi:hypothetical protein
LFSRTVTKLIMVWNKLFLILNMIQMNLPWHRTWKLHHPTITLVPTVGRGIDVWYPSHINNSSRWSGTPLYLRHKYYNWYWHINDHCTELLFFNCHLSNSLCHCHALKLQLIYNRQSVGQSVLVSGAHLGPVTNFSFSLKFLLDSCGFVIC